MKSMIKPNGTENMQNPKAAPSKAPKIKLGSPQANPAARKIAPIILGETRFMFRCFIVFSLGCLASAIGKQLKTK